MARQDIDLYQIGSTPEALQSALLLLRQDFDAHNHDGSSSRAFETLRAETLSIRALSIRKSSYSDNTSGLWTGFDGNLMRLNLGDGTNFLKWDGSSLSIAGSITATSGTIGGWTIGSTSLTGGGVVLSTIGVTAQANTVKLDGGNNRILVGSGINISGTSAGLITVGSGISIDGTSTGIITGGTIRTASSGARVELIGSSSTIVIYDSGGTDRVTSFNDGFRFKNSSGTTMGDIYAGTSSILIDISSSTGSIFLDAGSSGTVSLGRGGTSHVVWNGTELAPTSSGVYSLGNISFKWDDIWNTGIHIYQGFDQPVVHFGYVDSTTPSITQTNSGSWSVSNPSTGVFTITHNMGTTNYVVLATALRASRTGAYIAKISDRSSNSFTVIIFDDTGTVQDGDFMFAAFEIA